MLVCLAASGGALASSGDAAVRPPAPVIAAAGDIACDPDSATFNGGLGTSDACRQQATSNLLVGQGLAAVLPLGDTQYECGSYDAFQRSYDLSWGRVKSISHPALGNHEYESFRGGGCDPTGSASGYFRYFGAAAGDPSKGYYSYNIGGWHLIALNSNCSNVGGCDAGSPQEQWLRNDLASNTAACTIAYWHHPRYTSGVFRPGFSRMAPLYKALYDDRADVVLSGHEHGYERFAPQDEAGRLDLARGLRSFVVGTGGDDLFKTGSPIANSEADVTAFGVLQLTLRAGAYDWRFVDVAGRVRDSGSDLCDGTAPDTVAPSTPVVLSASSPSAGRVEVQWEASSDDVGVNHYDVYRNGAFLAATSTRATRFSDTTARASTRYAYRIKARDAAGNVSAASNTASVLVPDSGALTRAAAEAALTRRLLAHYPTYNAYFTQCRHRTRPRFRCTWRAVARRRGRVLAGTARVVRRPHRWRVATYPLCRNRPRCFRYGGS